MTVVLAINREEYVILFVIVLYFDKCLRSLFSMYEWMGLLTVI